MLGKLLKYDLKNDIFFYYIMTAVIAGATLLCAGAITVMTRSEFDNPFIYLSGCSMLFMYFIILVAAGIFTAVIIFKRFYSHNFAQQGYLTFTLPVKAEQIYWSKYISALIWMVWTCALIALSLTALVVFTPFREEVEGVAKFFDMMFSIYDYSVLVIILNVVSCIVSTLFGIFVMYLAICIGQNFNVHRVIAAVAAYFVIRWITKTIASLCSWMILFALEITMENLSDFTLYTNITTIVKIVINIAVIVAGYIYSIKKMSKGLNLK